MILARVIGQVVATQKDNSHVGRKILRVQPLDLDGRELGESLLALDALDAGIGDRVVVTPWMAGAQVGRYTGPELPSTPPSSASSTASTSSK